MNEYTPDTPKSKKCTKCGQISPATLQYFSKASKQKDGLGSYCRECNRAHAREWKEKNKDRVFEPANDPAHYKICAKCGQSKPATIEFFSKNKRHPDGLGSYCHQCNRKHANDWYYKNPEKARESWRRWYSNNRDTFNASNRRWHENNRERDKANRLAYQEKHKGQLQEKKRQYYLDNADEFRRKSRAHYQANKERAASYSRQWRQANPEKRRAIHVNRRARKAQAEGIHTAEDLIRIRGLQNDQCLYCGRNLNGTGHLDHFIPLSRGGRNSKENLVWACPDCNMSKNDVLPWDWHKWNGALPIFWDGRLL